MSLDSRDFHASVLRIYQEQTDRQTVKEWAKRKAQQEALDEMTRLAEEIEGFGG